MRAWYVPIDPATLKPLSRLVRIVSYATSLTVGFIGGQWAVWVLDGRSGLLFGVALVDGTLERINEFGVPQGAHQVLYAGDQMRLLYPQRACLATFDSNSQQVDDPIPVARGALSMSTSDGDIYVAGAKNVTIIETGTRVVSPQVLRITQASKLIGADEYGGVLMMADAGGLSFAADSDAVPALTVVTGTAKSCQA